jgi:S1-C subfamily serine protease
MPSGAASPDEARAPVVSIDTAAVVRIDAADCGTPSRRGSGFVWKSTEQVVTALHVVAGCKTVGVRYAGGSGQSRSAQVVQVLPAHDLALLTVNTPLSVKPFVLAPTPPSAGAQLVAWGYPVAVRGLLDTGLRRRETAGQLKSLLNDRLRLEVAAAGMPALESEIMLLDGGHLLPGHSGGPIVDEAGNVVAVADGGLEQGATEISWAVPALRVAQLASSTQTVPSTGHSVGALFSAEVGADSVAPGQPAPNPSGRANLDNPPGLKCGAGVLTKVRTRPFAELYQSADDQLGLQQLVMSSGQLLQPNDSFDVYQDLKTGATVVVPGASPVRETAGVCVADVHGTALQLVIELIATAPNPLQIDQAASLYESHISQRLGTGWQIDPAWTYVSPMSRFDGLVVRRKAQVQSAMNNYGMQQTVRYAFETLASRGSLLLGVVGVRHDVSPGRLQMQQACAAGVRLPACGDILQELRRLAQMNVATHLSTFPIG